jgi:SAM-dependent methyltransferase
MTEPVERVHSFGEAQEPSPIDRLGVWLSGYRIRREVPDLRGADLIDVGCGYQAAFSRSVLDTVGTATLVDLRLAEDLRQHPKVRAVEGRLPAALDALPDASFDLVVCMSVLEHLPAPEIALAAFRRLLRPGGTCLINVPSWMGKRFLELSAFRLGLSPREEMDDHKRYYDPKDLWPMLVAAGFVPHNISCRRHKFGLNVFATCRTEPTEVAT